MLEERKLPLFSVSFFEHNRFSKHDRIQNCHSGLLVKRCPGSNAPLVVWSVMTVPAYRLMAGGAFHGQPFVPELFEDVMLYPSGRVGLPSLLQLVSQKLLDSKKAIGCRPRDEFGGKVLVSVENGQPRTINCCGICQAQARAQAQSNRYLRATFDICFM